MSGGTEMPRCASCRVRMVTNAKVAASSTRGLGYVSWSTVNGAGFRMVINTNVIVSSSKLKNGSENHVSASSRRGFC